MVSDMTKMWNRLENEPINRVSKLTSLESTLHHSTVVLAAYKS